MQIPADQVRFHTASYADSNGRVFWWEGQLYRGISDKAANLYRGLFDRGVIRRLSEHKLLIDTELTEFQLPGYPLVVKHRVVPFISYAPEWCGEMLRAAACTVLELQQELSGHGLTLQDAHPWNVLFDGPQPYFVDMGSIVPVTQRGGWGREQEFRSFFLNPLLLMSQGHGRMARLMLNDANRGVTDEDALAVAPLDRRRVVRGVKTIVKSLARKVVSSGLRASLRSNLVGGDPAAPRDAAWFRGLKRQIEAIPLPQSQTVRPDDNEEFPAFTPDSNWSAKHFSIRSILERTNPATILDLTSNRGWYAQLAATRGAQVAASDFDEPSVTRMYFDAKKYNLPILPLLVDFRNPSAGWGPTNEVLPPALQRLRAEMVLALTVMHYLVFRQTVHFEQILAGLSAYCKRWLVVEFIGREDRYVREWGTRERHPWHSLQEFKHALEGPFRVIEDYPSNLAHRTLLLCERRNDG